MSPARKATTARISATAPSALSMELSTRTNTTLTSSSAAATRKSQVALTPGCYPRGPHAVCEHVFVTSDGHQYSRFKRALATRNLNLIRAAAAELPQVSLGDALVVCVATRGAGPARFERAALRWLAGSPSSEPPRSRRFARRQRRSRRWP